MRDDASLRRSISPTARAAATTPLLSLRPTMIGACAAILVTKPPE
jgi:hypothetical protein